MISCGRIREVLDYQPATGAFTWKAGTRLAGEVAGAVNKRGYIVIQVDGRKHYAHRLAWAHVHGEFPSGEVDHVNRDRRDNRLSNLREATRFGNNRNAVRPKVANLPRGVFKNGNKYEARIRDGKRYRYLGLFDSPDLAHEAYRSAATAFHGDFACLKARDDATVPA